MQHAGSRNTVQRIAWVGGSLVGLLLFVWSVRQAGVDHIVDDVRSVGPGFIVILALAGVREAVRAQTWRLSVEPPNELPYLRAVSARVTGEAVGNLTPLGLLISEPAKALLVREHVPPVAALSALALDQLFYSVSVVVMIVAGVVALLSAFPLPAPVRVMSLATIAGATLFTVGLSWVVARQPRLGTAALQAATRAIGSRRALQKLARPVMKLEERLYGLSDHARSVVGPVAALLVVFHAAAVAEVYVTLALVVPDDVSFLPVFILEAVNRVISVVFKFVPLRLGVDEAGSGMVSEVLQLGTAAGVSLAIVRKARVLAFGAIGMALLALRGWSMRRLVAESAGDIRP